MNRTAIEALFNAPGVRAGRSVGEALSVIEASTNIRTAAPESEKEFQADVVDIADDLGWSTFHMYNARKNKAGWPDLTFYEAGPAFFAELKVWPNTCTPDQLCCHERLRRGGNAVFVWYPEHWNQIVQTLRNRRHG